MVSDEGSLHMCSFGDAYMDMCESLGRQVCKRKVYDLLPCTMEHKILHVQCMHQCANVNFWALHACVSLQSTCRKEEKLVYAFFFTEDRVCFKMHA
jgi:hypothetical protein